VRGAATTNDGSGREVRPQRPGRGVAVWFFNRNRLLFNNWEEANKRTTQLGRALG